MSPPINEISSTPEPSMIRDGVRAIAPHMSTSTPKSFRILSRPISKAGLIVAYRRETISAFSISAINNVRAESKTGDILSSHAVSATFIVSCLLDQQYSNYCAKPEMIRRIVSIALVCKVLKVEAGDLDILGKVRKSREFATNGSRKRDPYASLFARSPRFGGLIPSLFILRKRVLL